MVCRREHLLILKSYMLCRKSTFFLTDVLILKDRSSFFPHVTWFIGHLITLNYNSNLNQSDSEWSVSKSTLPVLHINEDRLLRGKLLSYGSLCRCMVTRPRFNEIAVQENAQKIHVQRLPLHDVMPAVSECLVYLRENAKR